MKHSRAQLRFDVVADDRQIFVSKSFCPNRIAGDEDGNVVYEGDSGLVRAAGVKPGRFIGADRQIIDHAPAGRISPTTAMLLAVGYLSKAYTDGERIVLRYGTCDAVAAP